jgi:hypothetical protein
MLGRGAEGVDEKNVGIREKIQQRLKGKHQKRWRKGG